VTHDAYPARRATLRRVLESHDDLLVAFSGGVDSSVLLHAATTHLGSRAAGLLADSPSLPRRELEEARAFAAAIGARLTIVPTRELDEAGYVANDGLRCYHCKRTLFESMARWGAENGFRTLAFGQITDDLRDDRPGERAARELAVVAPLLEAGFSKADVRRYAREHGLAVADKPASACLASRVPLGTPVSAERLGRIEEAEERVRSLGFRVVRVRDHGSRARLEVGADESERARGLAAELARRLAGLGFVELELAVYGAGQPLSAGRWAGALPAAPAPGS
jgi:uncharacterized protein